MAGLVIVLRCSQKLLKRLRALAKPPEPPAPPDNPLRAWCADIDFIDRHPFALVMNATTGAVLVLPARAADLKRLHVMAAQQLVAIFNALGIHGTLAQAELDVWVAPPAFTANRDRSLVASLNQRKFEAWLFFAEQRMTAFEVAMRMLETPFGRKDLGRGYHFAADLLRARLLPSAAIIPFSVRPEAH